MPPSRRTPPRKKLLLPLLVPLILTAAAAHGSEFTSVQDAYAAIQARWQRLASYSCLYSSHALLLAGDKGLTARYSFAKPSLVRMEIIGGSGAGTTLLWDGGPKVRVRKKGLLSLFPVSMDLRNPRLLDPFNEDLSNSSWKFLIEQGGRALKEGRLDLESGAGPGPIILVHHYPSGAGPFSKDRVFVDRASLVPERVERYAPSGLLVEEIHYRDVQLDPVLPAQVFKDF